MKLSMDEILLINGLEKISKVNAKDCIVKGNVVTYFVKEKAIGKKAKNIKELENKLKKKVEIIGFQEKPEDVIIKTYEVKPKETIIKKDKLIIKLEPIEKKKILSNIARLRRIRELIQRNYGLGLVLN